MSISRELAEVSPQLEALAERGGDHSPHRQDEPYRRAIVGCYGRLAATRKALIGAGPARRPSGAQGEPYTDPRPWNRSQDHRDSLTDNGAPDLAQGGCWTSARAWAPSVSIWR